MNRTSAKRNSREAGFTLMEILVSLLIIMIITLVVRSSKTTYERTLFMSNLAYDVALSVREAQVYAMNVRRDKTNDFDVGYGVRFNANSKSYTLFVDRDSNHWLSGDPERMRLYTVQGGSTIASLCVVYANDVSICVPKSSVSVSFRRPDSEACIATAAVSSVSILDCIEATGISKARITVAADNGSTREVYISSSGQITVQ